MSALSLTTAVATYGHTRPLWDGTLSSDRVSLEHIELVPITRAFRRMVRGLEFDMSEMALSTYLCARAHGKRMTALPVFLTRRFEHGQIVYNVKSGMNSPSDLTGRRVGVRSYTLTPGVWVRGILQHAYGVDLDEITWVLVGDEHVAEYNAPANVVSAPEGSDLETLLLAGDIDAAIGVNTATSPDIRPLVSNPQHAAIDYYKQTGIYPISHIAVVKDAMLEAHPWLAEALCTLFKTAKEYYLRQLNTDGTGDAQDKRMNELRQVVGDDPLPYGIAANRATLDAFIQFNVEQKVIPHAVNLEDLFPSNVLEFAA